jgi:hypothetical protein
LQDGSSNWPELLPTLFHILSEDNINVLEGALGALQKICEDSADRLDQLEISAFMSKLLPFINSSHTKLRALSLNAINCILVVQNESISELIDPYLVHLFQLANDEDQVSNFIVVIFFPNFIKGGTTPTVQGSHIASRKLHGKNRSTTWKHRRVYVAQNSGFK